MADVFEVHRGGFRAAKGQRKSSQDKTLTAQEFKALLSAAAADTRKYGSTAYDLFALAGNFGLRCGEVLDLSKEDFKSLPMGYFRVRTLKQRASVPDRIYTGRAGQDLAAQVLERRSRLTRGEQLFPFGTRSARYYFAFFAGKAGISPNVSFHALRHTAAQRLLDSLEGTKYAARALNIVQTFLRHKPTNTQIYTEPTAQMMIEAMNLRGVVR